MKIENCKGARVHAALSKNKKGTSKISWKVNYGNESIWCNSMEDVAKILQQITPVMLHGEEYKTWKVGETPGWQQNSKKELKEEVKQ